MAKKPQEEQRLKKCKKKQWLQNQRRHFVLPFDG
jgi:hypothetical protein